LIQTIGRAARHERGQVIMYADRVTDSMQRAIDETNRRRAVQESYNEMHGITPQTIIKAQMEMLPHKEREVATAVTEPTPLYFTGDVLAELDELENAMRTAAQALEFEKAARLRDQIMQMRKQLEPA
jgi:excinuclease ABC subunit B